MTVTPGCDAFHSRVEVDSTALRPRFDRRRRLCLVTASRREECEEYHGARALLIGLAVPIVALAGAQVPFKGADRGNLGGLGSHGCGALAPVFVETSGQATHVGAYSYSARECVNFATSTYSGAWELTAANGDKLIGTYAGSFEVVGTDIAYEQENTVTGGSGRFAEAEGSFDVGGIASTLDFSDVQVLEGTISSVGSSK